jgi:hypothetical protein
MKQSTITNFVILVVVLLWATSAIVGMFRPTYQIPGTVQLAMTAVAAFLFGSKVLQKSEPLPPKTETKKQ